MKEKANHWLGKKHTKNTKLKISLAMKGKKHTKETKEKMSKNSAKYWAGKKRPSPTKETRTKMSIARKGKKRPEISGKNHHNWKGGTDIENWKKLKEKWRKINYERILHLNKRWRASRRGAIGSHTLGEWENLKSQYNWTCPCCGKEEPKIKLTEDHIIPLSKGGSDNIENIQPLCRSCNSKKHTLIIKY